MSSSTILIVLVAILISITSGIAFITVPLSEVSTHEEFMNLRLESSHMIVAGIFNCTEEELEIPYRLPRVFKEASINLGHLYNFTLIRDPKLLDIYPDYVDNIVIFFNSRYETSEENGRRVYVEDHNRDDDVIEDDLWDWLKNNRLPLVSEVSNGVPKRFFTDNIRPLFVVFVRQPKEDILKDMRAMLSNIAGSTAKEGIYFTLTAIGDFLKAETALDMTEMMAEGELDVYWGIFTNEDAYQMDQNSNVFSYENILDFVNRFIRGDLSRVINSKPDNTPSGPNTAVAMGKTFMTKVLDPSKHVVVYLYSPTCGHCKKFSPLFDQLATGFKDIDVVTFVKMDAVANSYPKGIFKVTGYPSIFYLPSGDQKTAQKFQDRRSLHTVATFVAGRLSFNGVDVSSVIDIFTLNQDEINEAALTLGGTKADIMNTLNRDASKRDAKEAPKDFKIMMDGDMEAKKNMIINAINGKGRNKHQMKNSRKTQEGEDISVLKRNIHTHEEL